MRYIIINERYSKEKIFRLWSSFLLASYMCVLLLRYLTIIPVLFANILIVFIGSMAIMQSLIKKKYSINAKILVFLILYTFFGIISYFYNGNADVQELVWPLGTIGIGFMLLNNRLSYGFIRFIYYSYCFVFVMICLFSNLLTTYSLQSSRNNISVLLLLAFCLVFFAAYQNKKTITLDIPIALLAVCLLSIGRSGIILGLIALFLCIVVKMENGKSSFISIKWVFLSGIVLVLLYFLISNFMPRVLETAVENFERKQLESSRLFIWRDYIIKTKSSLINFMLGSKVSGTEWLEKYNGNLHNSFFALHSKYGIIMLATVIFMVIRSLMKLFKERNYYLLIPLLLIVFRINFDYCSFNGCLDNVLFYILFFHFYNHDSLRDGFTELLLEQKHE